MLDRKLVKTEDGSATIYIPEWNESYHSKHGAVQEAYHVFIQNGLNLVADRKEIRLLEFGFGTGLNALITYIEALRLNLTVDYVSLEKFPVSVDEFNQLHFAASIQAFKNEEMEVDSLDLTYRKLMATEWESKSQIDSNFYLTKYQTDFFDYEFPNEEFDLVYFDAFGARVQPELWTEELFSKIYSTMKSGGVFTTYSSKGSVRRALLAVGFEVEKVPGPPGKREMLIAKK